MSPRHLLIAAALSCSLLACERPAPPPARAEGGVTAAPPAAPPAAAPPGPAGAPQPAPPPTAQPATPSVAPSTAPPAAAAAAPPGTTTGATTAAPPAPPAGPAAAPPLDLVEAQALIPGAATPLAPGQQTIVDPGATFRVVLKGTYLDARLSILDGADAMLAGAGGREAGPVTTVTFQPAAPLKPGSAYRLRIDGAATREVTAADGSTRAPVELGILAAGEPPPSPKPKPKSKRPPPKRP